MQVISGTLVAAFAIFLIWLAGVSLFNKPAAKKFLGKFASSARAHFTEQALRLLAGTGLIIFSSSMWYPTVFLVFGWILVITSIGLMLVPWRWHHEYAKWAIPLAINKIWLLAVGAFGLGVFILYGLSGAFYQ